VSFQADHLLACSFRGVLCGYLGLHYLEKLDHRGARSCYDLCDIISLRCIKIMSSDRGFTGNIRSASTLAVMKSTVPFRYPFDSVPSPIFRPALKNRIASPLH